MRGRWFAAVISTAVLGLVPLRASAQFVLDPGTIIAENSFEPGSVRAELVKYSRTGTVLDTLALSLASANLGVVDGLTVLGGNVYLTGTAGGVGVVDLTTGAVTRLFDTPGGAEALGDNDANLLVGLQVSGDVDEYTPGGAAVRTIPTGVDMTGVDASASSLFVGSFTTGDVSVFDLGTGAPTGTIATGVGESSLSGLGFDWQHNTIWISTGFNQDDIREYDMAGNLLTQFASGRTFIDGLDVVPQGAPPAAVPEPGALALLAGLAAPGLFLLRRRTARA